MLSQSRLEERVSEAISAADAYLYPVKADPDPRVLETVVRAGAGLDLCSRGDLALALAVTTGRADLCFTSPNLDASLACDLVRAGATIDVDSVEQIDCLPADCTDVGVRLCTADHLSAYGSKFGVRSTDLEGVVQALRAHGARLTGLHVHDAHANGSADDMAARIGRLLREVPARIIRNLTRVNLGGGWPAPGGNHAPVNDIARALGTIREVLASAGFSGTVTVEPGEWVIGPCTWLVARVAAVKPHPVEDHRTVVVLDTATPVPCRPCNGPFEVARDGCWLETDRGDERFDVFGSANTGLDTIGLDVAMARPRVGDVVAVAGQGAYARQLTGSFNERPLPRLSLIP